MAKVVVMFRSGRRSTITLAGNVTQVKEALLTFGDNKVISLTPEDGSEALVFNRAEMEFIKVTPSE